MWQGHMKSAPAPRRHAATAYCNDFTTRHEYNRTFVYIYKVSKVDVVNLDGPGVLNKLLSLPTTIPELQVPYVLIYDFSILPLLNLVIILEATLLPGLVLTTHLSSLISTYKPAGSPL